MLAVPCPFRLLLVPHSLPPCSTSGFPEIRKQTETRYYSRPRKFASTWGCLKGGSLIGEIKGKLGGVGKGVTVLGNQGPTAQEHVRECEG